MITRRALLRASGGVAAAALLGRLGGSPLARAAGAAASTNPIVAENRATDPRTWSDAFQIGGGDFSYTLGGFVRRTSVDVGEPVPLDLVEYDTASERATRARIDVYRLGYYGGRGGRLVHTSPEFALPTARASGQGEVVSDRHGFGLRSCHAWNAQPVVIPGGALAVSGLHLIKVVTTATADGSSGNLGRSTHIPLVVRDDGRPRDLLAVMPTNTWQAYNGWPFEGGKSLYFFNSSTDRTIAGRRPSDGRSRAVKVSFDRPFSNQVDLLDWPLHSEFPLVFWLERMGFRLSYADDLFLHRGGEQLDRRRTATIVIAGHSEYWTQEMRDNVVAARDAGVNLASFSANTAYWKVRLEPGLDGTPDRTLVCFKTVEGTGEDGTGATGVNDFGPGATRAGTRVDCRGPDHRAGRFRGVADDLPRFATTTFRDRGAAWDSPGRDRPPSGRVGVVGPAADLHVAENRLWGVMYLGSNTLAYGPLEVPPGTGDGGEFTAHPAWRHTSVAGGGGGQLGDDLVGWEWDAIPSGRSPQYRAFAAGQPRGVRRLSESPAPPGGHPQFLLDDGRRTGREPPHGQPALVHAITYRAQSGALVFAAGTLQWVRGLGPYYKHRPQGYEAGEAAGKLAAGGLAGPLAGTGAANAAYLAVLRVLAPRRFRALAAAEVAPGPETYLGSARRDSSLRDIQQATCNLLVDIGARPDTPMRGVVVGRPRAYLARY